MRTFFLTSSLIAALGFVAAGCGGGDSGDGGTGAGGSAGSSVTIAGSTNGGSTVAGSAGHAGAATTAGTSGTAAGGSSAGSGSGGTSSGGGATGPGLSQMACSPGTSIDAFSAYPDTIQNCGFDGKGELAGMDGFFSSIKLPNPIGPGDKFSFSVDLNGKLGMGSMELWGGTGECGDAHEHFATVTIPPGGVHAIACMTAEPKTGTYPYLIWVLHTAGQHGDVTLCPDVSCPAE
jgi:hypothetical protein